MVRYEFDDGPIKIAYGSDDITSGLFLSVYDQRLEWQQDATDEVNGVSEGIGDGDGGGCYLSLCTGSQFFPIFICNISFFQFILHHVT